MFPNSTYNSQSEYLQKNHQPSENSSVPFLELSPSARLDKELQKYACSWLDEYILFSMKWSPQSFPGYHEACGLMILSTVAARRIHIAFGPGESTNLYIMLCGRTGLTVKTRAMNLVQNVLSTANLGFLLLPDTITPQSMVNKMSLKLPERFDSFSTSEKEKYLKALAFAGQRGWCYDEMGQLFQGMGRQGAYEEFHSLLRRFDDNKPQLSKSTLKRGDEIVENPYLAFLGGLTPADMNRFARPHSNYWADGFLARYAIITSPNDYSSTERYPVEAPYNVPQNIVAPLQQWHERLGIPVVSIVNGEPVYSTGFPSQTLTLSKETCEAFYAYQLALKGIIIFSDNHDLDGNYIRFPSKALRIAALFASLSDSSTIELTHWAKAQAITENWRQYLHNLYDTLGGVQNRAPDTYEKILRIIELNGEVTSRIIQASTKIKTDRMGTLLGELIQAGYITEINIGRTCVYKICDMHPPFVESKHIIDMKRYSDDQEFLENSPCL